MPYWQLFYHIVWATKKRTPLLTPDVEPIIYGFLRSKAIGLGATVFALNGVADHVHIVVAIPPKIAVAKFIGQVKAVASTKFNKSGLSTTPFFWQEEYGAFSFDGKRLPNYITYVERQKEHHAQGTIIPILERIEGGPVKIVRELTATYTLDEGSWRRELEAMSIEW
jgi:putative transposase